MAYRQLLSGGGGITPGAAAPSLAAYQRQPAIVARQQWRNGVSAAVWRNGSA